MQKFSHKQLFEKAVIFPRYWLRRYCRCRRQLCRKPYRHIALSTVSPCIIRYHCQRLVGSHETSFVIISERLHRERHLIHSSKQPGTRNDIEFRHQWQQHSVYTEVVVGPLGTVHKRSALHGNTSAVVCDRIMGFHCADRHVEMYSHRITLLPLAVDDKIAVAQLAADFITIDLYRPSRGKSAIVGIQVARDNGISYPSGNAYIHSELVLCLWLSSSLCHRQEDMSLSA